MSNIEIKSTSDLSDLRFKPQERLARNRNMNVFHSIDFQNNLGQSIDFNNKEVLKADKKIDQGEGSIRQHSIHQSLHSVSQHDGDQDYIKIAYHNKRSIANSGVEF